MDFFSELLLCAEQIRDVHTVSDGTYWFPFAYSFFSDSTGDPSDL